MTVPLDKVTTKSLPATALATVAVYTMLPPSVIAVPAVADDKVTVIGSASSTTVLATVPVVVSASKLPVVFAVWVAVLMVTGAKVVVPWI